MRKPSSGIESTLWAIGGVGGLYLAGGALLIMNLWTLAFPLENMLPRWMVDFLELIYSPLGDLLAFLNLLP